MAQTIERKEPITDFIRKLAQIDDDAVILQHIKMFVNEYSLKRIDFPFLIYNTDSLC